MNGLLAIIGVFLAFAGFAYLCITALDHLEDWRQAREKDR